MIDPSDGAIVIHGGCVGAEERDWLAQHLRRAAALVRRAATGEPVAFARVDVRIVDDAAMTRLHEKATGDATTTDVLTWVERRDDGAVEADLALCADEALRQSRARGHERRDELLLYGVHGLLHAAGYDDREAEGFERLHREEARIVAALGGRATVGPEERPADAPPVPGSIVPRRAPQREGAP